MLKLLGLKMDVTKWTALSLLDSKFVKSLKIAVIFGK